MNQYNKVNSFGEILTIAEEIVKESETNYLLNFNLKVEFDVSIIREVQLAYALKDAEDWQNTSRPTNLHINHGEYIGEKGIIHIVNELKNKKDSNRAVISLISQKHIINSGDTPIPSFMSLQFGLENNDLYVTTYFRALEIYNFLPINLEEIRLIINQLNQEIAGIDKVKLNLIAFRAYANPDQTTLSRFEVDILPSSKILLYMQTNPEKIISILKDKLKESTVTEKKGFVNILEIINDQEFDSQINKCFKQPLVIQNFRECIKKTDELTLLRSKTSHNPYIKELNNVIKSNLENIIKELERCL
ncbi:thymidylate synthase family protein [Mesobacillus jeotgali]|uniref:hypothetical protein n=1 Tax=Mesobacillus jeotgali TaxID=129985 RepID=UPI000C845195|nr:hypothetical protein [Mesobacillus jeotgali]